MTLILTELDQPPVGAECWWASKFGNCVGDPNHLIENNGHRWYGCVRHRTELADCLSRHTATPIAYGTTPAA